MCGDVRKDPSMQRFVAIIVAVAVLVGLAVLVVVDAPAPEKASAKSSRDTEVTSSAAPAARPTAAAGPSSAVTTTPARGATPPAVRLQKLPQAFSQPVFVTAPPGDTSRLFVVEKAGKIVVVRNGSTLATPFLDLSSRVSTGGEQGLLSMAFDPRYKTNGRFYVDYTNVNGDTRVVRYTVSRGDPNVANAGSARIILSVHQPYSNHNGGQLQFGPDGRLYVGLGDGGSEGDPNHYGQNRSTLLAKILRLNVNVSPVRVQKYAMGLRNPWRFSFDRKTGALWIGDVGQNKWEEIDYLRPGAPAGANFGWSAYEGTHVYNSAIAATVKKSSLTWPVTQYSHSVGDAVTGGYVYRGTAIPALRGFYLFGDFGSGRVWAMKGPGGAPHRLSGADGQVSQISSFGQDASGELYIASLTGSVYKIVPR
jgi:glucose/arabinose dehydrogenase